MSFLSKLTRAKVSRNVESDLPPITQKRLRSAQAAQLVLDRIPKHMVMHPGDEYFVPISVGTIRVDVEWAKVGRMPVDVECSAILLDNCFRRIDYLSCQRRQSRDKAMFFSPDDSLSASQTKRDSISIRLKQMSPEVFHIIFVITIKSLSKTLADLVGPAVIVSDLAYFPGCPELVRYTFDAEERFFPGAILLMISTNTFSSPSIDDGSCRRWSIRAVDHALPARNFRQMSETVEMFASKYTAPAAISVGGDHCFVVADELFRRAHRLPCAEDTSHSDATDSSTCSADDTDDSDGADSLRLFYVANGVSSFRPPEAHIGMRPTIVRKGPQNYTTGKGLQKRDEEGDEESEDTEDQHLLSAAFPRFDDRHVVRYGTGAYNIGSEPASLYSHIALKKKPLRIDVQGKPLEVNFVSNEAEYEINGATPLKPDLPDVMRNVRMTPSAPSAPRSQGTTRRTTHRLQ